MRGEREEERGGTLLRDMKNIVRTRRRRSSVTRSSGTGDSMIGTSKPIHLLFSNSFCL